MYSSEKVKCPPLIFIREKQMSSSFFYVGANVLPDFLRNFLREGQCPTPLFRRGNLLLFWSSKCPEGADNCPMTVEDSQKWRDNPTLSHSTKRESGVSHPEFFFKNVDVNWHILVVSNDCKTTLKSTFFVKFLFFSSKC